MRRVLIVSPRFPPTNAPDMHRVRQSLPYLPAEGWEPTVLAVDPVQCDMSLDPLLERTVPGDVRVVRTHAFDFQRTRRFGLGALDLRALPFVARAGDRLLGSEKFDLVYFSTTAFSLLALGPRWARLFGVPFIVDLQDPWSTGADYYSRTAAPAPPGGHAKYALSRVLARVLEPRVMRSVSHVISVSPAYPELLMQRYPSLGPERFTVLPFGAPLADFEMLRHERVPQTIFDRRDGLEHWVYVGAAGGMMLHALAAFFTALQRSRGKSPERFARLRLHFVGTDYAPGGRARKMIEPLAQVCGVADVVEEHPQRIPYFQALQCLLDAEALIVLGSDDPGYTASKIYPYILAGKPLLAVFHERSSVVEVLRKTKAGTAVSFSSGEDSSALAARITSEWFEPRRWRVPAQTDWTAFEPYTAQAMTRQQCAVFDRVLEEDTYR